MKRDFNVYFDKLLTDFFLFCLRQKFNKMIFFSYTEVKLIILLLIVFLSSIFHGQTTSVTIDNLLGINSRVTDPLSAQAKFSTVRAFAPWVNLTGYDNNNVGSKLPLQSYSFNPANDGDWNYDQYLTSIGGGLNYVLQGTSPFHRGMNVQPAASGLELKPIYSSTYANNSINWLTATLAEIKSNYTITSDPFQLDPQNYLEHAAAATWIATRYGTGVSNSALITAYRDYQNQPGAPIGLGTLGSLEGANETDRWWRDLDSDLDTPEALYQLRPEYFASMVSADFDGHGNSATLRVTNSSNQIAQLGIINAAPNTKVVLPGLSNFRTGYLERAFGWWVKHRKTGTSTYGFSTGDQLPFDAFNFHHYAIIGSPQTRAEFNDLTISPDKFKQAPGTEIKTAGADARSPEEEKLKEKLQWTIEETALAANARGVASNGFINKEFYLSEVGYDTEISSQSSYDVPGNNRSQRWLTQGQWLTRTVLEVAAAKVDLSNLIYPDPEIEPYEPWSITNSTVIGFSEVHLFDLRDEVIAVPQPPNEYDQFHTSGLLFYDAARQVFTKKNSWYFLSAFKQALQGYTFVEELEVIIHGGGTPPEAPRAYLFAPENANLALGDFSTYRIVWWSPTRTGYTGYLDVQLISPSLKSIALGLPQFNGSNLDPAAFNLVAGSESPQYVVYDAPLNQAGRYYSDRKLRLRYMPISETPRIIDLQESIAPERPITMGAITSTGGCCDGRAVTWTYTLGTTGNSQTDALIPPPAFNVYAIPASAVSNNPSLFRPGMAEAHDISEGTYRTRAYASDLLPNVTYYVYVYPVNRASGRFLVDPTAAPTTYGTISAGCSGSCFIPASVMQVTGSNTSHQQQGLSIINAGAGLSCGQLPAASEEIGDCPAGDSGLPNWNTFDYTPNAANWVTVRFNEPYQLDAIFLEDDFGTGDLVIEGKVCDCETAWRPIRTYRTNSRCPGTLVKFLNLGNYQQIRFRKISDGAQVGAIAFCGVPIIQNCDGTIDPSGGGEARGNELEEITPLFVDVTKNTGRFVEVEWSVVDRFAGKPDLGQVLDYELQLFEIDSKDKDGTAGQADGFPIGEPVHIQLESSSTRGSHRYADLKAGQKYEVVVTAASPPSDDKGGKNSSLVTPCLPPTSPSAGSVTFYTHGDVSLPRNAPFGPGSSNNPQAKLGLEYSYGDWLLGPNPASSFLRVSHPAEAEELSVFDMNGRQIFFEKLVPGTTQSDISLPNTIPGSHLVTLRIGNQTLRKWIQILR